MFRVLSLPRQNLSVKHATRQSSSLATAQNESHKLSAKLAQLNHRQEYLTPAGLQEKIKTRKEGVPLPREWYFSEEHFAMDIQYLWYKQWLFAGYECQIRNPGDYFTYQVGNENVLIVRGDDGKIRGFFNVCRHRGARLCPKESGKVKNITCPYHSWSYNKEGGLIKFTHMQDQIDPANFGLIPCEIQSVAGLIFLNFSKNKGKPAFEPAAEIIAPELKHHRLEKAKIAHWRSDIVKANWKLVYENNRECYHCPNAHPEYIRANYDLMFSYVQKPDGTFERNVDLNHPQRETIVSHIEDCSQRWSKYGIKCSSNNNFPGDGWYRSSRMPLRKGWCTESLDGKPVGPIMGDFQESDRDMGSLRIHTLPNFWIHVSSDYAASSRLTPIDPVHTKVDQVWLVSEDAKEGVDYHLDKMLPFWEKTNISDWEICEYNQAGILSETYSPAPYSLIKEGGVETFVRWYLRSLNSGIDSHSAL